MNVNDYNSATRRLVA